MSGGGKDSKDDAPGGKCFVFVILPSILLSPVLFIGGVILYPQIIILFSTQVQDYTILIHCGTPKLLIWSFQDIQKSDMCHKDGQILSIQTLGTAVSSHAARVPPCGTQNVASHTSSFPYGEGMNLCFENMNSYSIGIKPKDGYLGQCEKNGVLELVVEVDGTERHVCFALRTTGSGSAAVHEVTIKLGIGTSSKNKDFNKMQPCDAVSDSADWTSPTEKRIAYNEMTNHCVRERNGKTQILKKKTNPGSVKFRRCGTAVNVDSETFAAAPESTCFYTMDSDGGYHMTYDPNAINTFARNVMQVSGCTEVVDNRREFTTNEDTCFSVGSDLKFTTQAIVDECEARVINDYSLRITTQNTKMCKEESGKITIGDSTAVSFANDKLIALRCSDTEEAQYEFTDDTTELCFINSQKDTARDTTILQKKTAEKVYIRFCGVKEEVNQGNAVAATTNKFCQYSVNQNREITIKYDPDYKPSRSDKKCLGVSGCEGVTDISGWLSVTDHEDKCAYLKDDGKVSVRKNHVINQSCRGGYIFIEAGDVKSVCSVVGSEITVKYSTATSAEANVASQLGNTDTNVHISHCSSGNSWSTTFVVQNDDQVNSHICYAPVPGDTTKLTLRVIWTVVRCTDTSAGSLLGSINGMCGTFDRANSKYIVRYTNAAEGSYANAQLTHDEQQIEMSECDSTSRVWSDSTDVPVADTEKLCAHKESGSNTAILRRLT